MLTPWHVLAQRIGMFALGTAALGGWITSLVDEAGDNRAIASLARASERADFELSCRYEEGQPVARIESEQFDALVALAVSTPDHRAALVDDLERLAAEKAAALDDRGEAVRVCDRRADDLYGP